MDERASGPGPDSGAASERGSSRDAEIERLVAGLRRSRKYRAVCPGTLARLAAWALARHPAPKAAARAARAKLHQVYAAYVTPQGIAALERLLAGAPAAPAPVELEALARAVLALHVSTAERMDFLKELYPRLLDGLAPRGSRLEVLDLACGLHPFALPWMGLPADAVYRAWDIDERLVAALNRFLGMSGRDGRAEARDLLLMPSGASVDLVFLLKVLPCLERQERGASLRLLRSLSARRVVVSFPARSLGGREKGMRDHYAGVIADLAAGLPARVTRITFPNEDFYLLESEAGTWR